MIHWSLLKIYWTIWIFFCVDELNTCKHCLASNHSLLGYIFSSILSEQTSDATSCLSQTWVARKSASVGNQSWMVSRLPTLREQISCGVNFPRIFKYFIIWQQWKTEEDDKGDSNAVPVSEVRIKESSSRTEDSSNAWNRYSAAFYFMINE